MLSALHHRLCPRQRLRQAGGLGRDHGEGGLAEVERDLIRTRTAESRSRATARGQRMGRPPTLTVQQQAEARQLRPDRATLKELADSYNVSGATILAR